MSGGAAPFTDRSPSEPEFRGFYGVPIDPKISMFGDQRGFLAKVEACKAQNGGEWLYKLHDFADRIYLPVERIIFEAIGLALEEAE